MMQEGSQESDQHQTGDWLHSNAANTLLDKAKPFDFDFSFIAHRIYLSLTGTVPVVQLMVLNCFVVLTCGFVLSVLWLLSCFMVLSLHC